MKVYTLISPDGESPENFVKVHDHETALADLRCQLRWAWSKLGCRCMFNTKDEKTHEDPHCPIHGIYGNADDREWELLPSGLNKAAK